MPADRVDAPEVRFAAPAASGARRPERRPPTSAADQARAGDRRDRRRAIVRERDVHQFAEARRRSWRCAGLRDLGRGSRGSSRRRRCDDRAAPVRLSDEQPGDEDERAAEVGAARDLALLARAFAVLGCRLLCALVACHRSRHVQRPERRAHAHRTAGRRSSPPTNGSDAATTSIATATLVGKPTAKTFSCGTTRETTPKATSVISSATRTGARDLERRGEDRRERLLGPADERAEPRRRRSAARVRTCGPRPRSVQASPPMTRKIIVPNSE